MSALKTGPKPMSQVSRPEPSATDSLIEYVVLEDQTVPANNDLVSPRSSYLPRQSESSSIQIPSNSFVAGTCEWPLRAPVEETQMRRMFDKARKKAAALFSRKRAFPLEPFQTSEGGYIAELQRQARAKSIPGPVRSKIFWNWQPSQRTSDRWERKMLRRMSPYTRERRYVTAESERKVLVLEDEGIDVMDFHPKHEVEEAERNSERRAKREAKEAKLAEQLEERD